MATCDAPRVKKIVVVGDPKTGKTNFCRKIMEACGNHVWNQNSSVYVPTKGAVVNPVIDGERIVKLWDCGGDPSCMGFVECYYENANGVVVIGPPRDWADRVRSVAGPVPVLHASLETDPQVVVQLWRS